MFIVRRSNHNPILSPNSEHPWESYATFNCCPVKVGSTTHLVYRAQSTPQKFGDSTFSLSTIGHATSKNGSQFNYHREFIVPELEWERYGCEDPRVTYLNGKYYIFYTALSVFPFNASGIKVGLAISKDMKTIKEKHLITPFNAKAMSLFPEKINGKFTVLLSANTDLPPAKIAIAQFDKEEEMWSEKYWDKWSKNIDKHTLTIPRKDGDQVEVGAPPIKTKEGWLLIYSHIENYMSEHKIFGIRAVLLDLKNPKKVIAQTPHAILVPEQSYEKYGLVPNITFPSGAVLNKDTLYIYYGGADTVCAVATVNFKNLLLAMLPEREKKYMVRHEKNPVLTPPQNLPWAKKAVFNPTAVDLKGKVHIVYRAMSDDNTSVMGYMASKDGYKIDEKLDEPIYVPREPYEGKGIPNGNSGCEDGRLTQIGDRIYLLYTAYNGIEAPRVAVSSINEKDFLAKKWDWSKPELVSPPGVDDKDACLFPDKINGKYIIIHRINGVICADYINSLDFKKEKTNSCTELFGPRKGMWDSKKVGLAGTPLKTKYGYIMLYHGISEDGTYRLGAALLSLKDPMVVLGRTNAHILEPQMPYEMHGQVGKVVFPCGAVIRKGRVIIYYGGADSVIGIASVKLDDLVSSLTK